tara:strand:+ start:96 stop:473 length:378 start_codon:yes stop_codon:yes gene_type:complete
MDAKSSNKSFGIVFFIVLLIVSLWPLLHGNEIRSWSLILSFVFLILGLLNSKILTPLNKAWIKLGDILGRIIAPIVMGIVFFLVVTPIGILMKVLGKDVLSLKLTKENSYWINRKKNIQSMKKQY